MTVYTLYYTKGWKYRNQEELTVPLRYNYQITEDYHTPYWSITKDGYLTAHKNCCWDGPTWFPDVDWMMIPSLIHDILHWAIDEGVIGEWANNQIDKELSHWVKLNEGKEAWLAFRGWYIQAATGLVDEKAFDQPKKVYTVCTKHFQ